MTRDQIRENYLDRDRKFRLLAAKEEKLLLLLSVLRLISFLGGFVLIWFAFIKGILPGIIMIMVVAGLFFFLLKKYSVHSGRKEFLNNLADINRNEAVALDGDLSPFGTGEMYIDVNHDFSNDLDMFGDHSLFQYLNRTVTDYGSDILSEWLSDPFPLSHELDLRQEAIKELAGKEEWRQEFLASGMNKKLDKKLISGLLGWMKESPVIKSSPFKRFFIWFLPALAIFSLILVIAGVVHYSVFVMVFLINLTWVASGLKKTNKIHNILTTRYNYFSALDTLLKSFEKEQFESRCLNDIKSNISGKTVSAAVSVRKLSRHIQAFDSRINIIVGFALNGLLLWDYHCIYKLEKWKSEYKDLFPVWLGMIGQVDAYISFGNYAHNNPEFVYPVKTGGDIIFSARDLGHQLIDEKKRVCNDFSLPRKGTVCIISGANMAGKSTFLRTIAVNYILGMAGSPVCAAEMSFTPLKLFTSMRTTDSLSHNESYFYAELKRLRLLKERIEHGEPILFILDEILKGTNSADKSLGSGLFLTRLVELGGNGLIATHDTSLGEMEKVFSGKVINKCFEVEIDGETIKFDYKLQDGITHKMNAALLMKQMGILG